MEHLRSVFAEFERLAGKPEALPKLRQAVDEAIEIIEGDCPDDAKRRVSNLMRSQWRRLSEQIAAFLNELGPTDWQQCNHFLALMEVFEAGLGPEPLLQEQRVQLNGKLVELL